MIISTGFFLQYEGRIKVSVGVKGSALHSLIVTRDEDEYTVNVDSGMFFVNGNMQTLPYVRSGLIISTASGIFVLAFLDLTVTLDKAAGVVLSARPSVYSGRVRSNQLYKFNFNYWTVMNT